MSGNKARFAIVLVLICATAAFLQARGQFENIPHPKPVSALSAEVGSWRSSDIPITPAVREALGPGDYLDRRYYQPGTRNVVEFFLGYFPTQRTGNTIHSPQHCLPGAGWQFESLKHVPLQLAGKKLQVNDAVLRKGNDRLFVIYWYQAHGRTIASEYWAKFYLVADAIRMNRSDGALVRFVTPILPGETVSDARSRVVELASLLSPRLKEHIPD